jgi:DnaJ-class molecular chaperone
MSVIYCSCDRFIDTDFEETYEDRKTGETVCELCWEPECDYCDGTGNLAGHQGLIKCRHCDGKGYLMSETEIDNIAYAHWETQAKHGEDA